MPAYLKAERLRVLTLTQGFWRSPFPRDRALSGAAREAPFVFSIGDTLVSGVIDLMWSTEGVWHIVDYKTNALDGRALDEVAAGYELQGGIYALAALRAGAEAVSMDLLFLERPDCSGTAVIRPNRREASGVHAGRAAGADEAG